MMENRHMVNLQSVNALRCICNGIALFFHNKHQVSLTQVVEGDVFILLQR